MKPLKIIKNFRYFESQEEGEWVILVTRKHWLILLLPLISGALLTAIMLGLSILVFSMSAELFGELDETAISAFQLILIMYATLMSFGIWLIQYLNVLVLSNKHIIDVSQKAFFSRSVSTLSLDSIEDVSIEKSGFLPTIFDFGHIRIQTAGELPNFELRSISDPERVQKIIMEAKAGTLEPPAV